MMKDGWFGTEKLSINSDITEKYAAAFQHGYRVENHMYSRDEGCFEWQLDITGANVNTDQISALLKDHLFTYSKYIMGTVDRKCLNLNSIDVDNPKVLEKLQGEKVPEFLEKLEAYKQELGLNSSGWSETGFAGKLTILAVVTARMRQSQLLSEDECRDFFDALPGDLAPETIDHLMKKSSELIMKSDEREIEEAGQKALNNRKKMGKDAVAPNHLPRSTQHALDRALRDGKTPVVVLDVDNLVYSSANPADKETNYERVSQNGMRAFLQERFGVDDVLSAELRKMLKLEGIGNGSTIAGLYALSHDRATGQPKLSQALEVLASKDQARIKALLSSEEAFSAGAEQTASEALQMDAAGLLDDFQKKAWEAEPTNGVNMSVEHGLRDALMQLHKAGAKIYAHSNSATYGVEKILRAVMQNDFNDIFGANAQHVYGVDKTGYHAKPTAESFKAVLAGLEKDGISRDQSVIVFADDSLSNCRAAQQHYDIVLHKANDAWREAESDEAVPQIPDESGVLAAALGHISKTIQKAAGRDQQRSSGIG